MDERLVLVSPLVFAYVLSLQLLYPNCMRLLVLQQIPYQIFQILNWLPCVVLLFVPLPLYQVVPPPMDDPQVEYLLALI